MFLFFSYRFLQFFLRSKIYILIYAIIMFDIRICLKLRTLDSVVSAKCDLAFCKLRSPGSDTFKSVELLAGVYNILCFSLSFQSFAPILSCAFAIITQVC